MNRGPRNDWNGARSRSIDVTNRASTACEPRPAPVIPEPWTDPTCRFAKAGDGHQCHRRDGSLLRYKADCHAEARAQLEEQSKASAARAAANTSPGPQYGYRAPVPAAVVDAHADCPSSAMTYEANGDARCTSCGTFWPMSRKEDGTPVGHMLAPINARTNARHFAAWAD